MQHACSIRTYLCTYGVCYLISLLFQTIPLQKIVEEGNLLQIYESFILRQRWIHVSNIGMLNDDRRQPHVAVLRAAAAQECGHCLWRGLRYHTSDMRDLPVVVMLLKDLVKTGNRQQLLHVIIISSYGFISCHNYHYYQPISSSYYHLILIGMIAVTATNMYL